MERGNFGTKIGVILATAGSAVGLGNIWRFPYMTGQNGGAAFILIYILCVIMFGIPGMVSEFIVGRHGAANAARAYKIIGGHKAWALVGIVGAITSMIILGFYAVVAGWCMQYLFASIFGGINGDAAYVAEYFKTFSSDAIKPTLWGITFILLTHLVVQNGVRNGIEKVSNLLMPCLFILLIIIVIAACLQPGAEKGIEFLLKPDFSKLNRNIFLEALGQAFFSLSLGTACLCTYASYFSRQTNLMKSAAQIAGIDTIVAILAGLMIFPAAFSVGVNPDCGPSLIFITLPNVFQQAFGGVHIIGYIIAILFYALLVLAALTSTISMHEIGTAFFFEELSRKKKGIFSHMNVSRKGGAWIESIICIIICIFCSLSMGGVKNLTLFNMSILDFCDFFTAQILLPLGAFVTCILVGWYVPKKVIRDEFTNWGTIRSTLFDIYLFAVRFICPICIIAIELYQTGLLK